MIIGGAALGNSYLMKKISVLLLSYNHENFIRRSIESVYLQKSSIYDIELIIFDDGSTDKTVEIIESFESEEGISIQFTKKEHQGISAIAANFNEMVSLATGDYLSFLASDDEYCENRFENQFHFLENNANTVLIYGNGFNFSDGEILSKVHSKKVSSLLRRESAEEVYSYVTHKIPVLFIQSILVRRSIFETFSPFDSDLIADDWVFNIKVFDYIVENRKKYSFIDEVVFLRNKHHSNTSRDVVGHFKRIEGVILRYSSSKRKKQLLYKCFVERFDVFLGKEFNKEDFLFFVSMLFKYPYIVIPFSFRVIYKLIGFPFRFLRSFK